QLENISLTKHVKFQQGMPKIYGKNQIPNPYDPVNYKGIAISLLVIVAVCSLITMSVFVLTPVPGAANSRLTVWDLFKPEFAVHDPKARWIGDAEVLYRNRDGHVIKFNFALNETDIILRNSTFVAFKVAKYSLSPDMKYVLFAYDVKQVYRHSYTASYIVYNIHTREVWELNPPEVQNAVLQHASWGVQGQQLIYIFENNIYYQSDVRSNSLRITSSGEERVIFNGIADWLYEEEILHSHITHWWSPDGERLAFLMINDTLVPNMFLPQFTGSTYPKSQEYPYPKAGQPNPVVRLLVVNLYGPTHTVELLPPESFRGREYYVVMVKWISSNHAAVRWLTRAQNASFLTVCDVTVGSCLQRHEETSDLWLTRQDQEPVFSKDGNRFFLTIPVKQGGQGEFHHIAMFTKSFRSDQSDVRHLTSGNWEVTKILAYDEDARAKYFLSSFSASTTGLFSRRCLTCDLNREECTFFDADISPNKQHVLLQCKGMRLVPYFILDSNMPLRAALEIKKISQTDVRISFYLLSLVLDGAPGSQSVSDKYELGWDSVLVSCDEVIVARLDGRGTGFRGQMVLQQVHQRLGTVEVQDQIAALEYLMTLPYIDRARIGIYGKGYGAYLTLMLLRSTALIQCDGGLGAAETTFCLFIMFFSFSANVHFQHSAELIKHLIKIGANYTMQIYPDEGHFLSLKGEQHLSESLVGYFRTCFQDFSTPLPEELGKEEDD
uniref:Dipeptidyl peptidase like 10 n=1 Tax=Esox lucius TaxID=8010 RepID=A0AAY5JWT6_ESOLU